MSLSSGKLFATAALLAFSQWGLAGSPTSNSSSALNNAGKEKVASCSEMKGCKDCKQDHCGDDCKCAEKCDCGDDCHCSHKEHHKKHKNK